jgi:hypothetical protein
MLPYAVALTLAGSAALLPAPAHGMTLGNVASQSMLGQPLRVVIPVDIGRGESLNSACIKLVADNVSRDAPAIVAARILLDDAGPSPRLIITSPKPYMEPAGSLSVQIGCGSTTRRDYVLLFEPAALQQPAAPVVVSEAEEAPWTKYRRVSETRTASAPRSVPPPVLVASAMPKSTWGTPVPLDAPAMPVPNATPPAQTAVASAATVAQAKPAEPPVIIAMAASVANPTPRELVTVAAPVHSGGFIGEAAAASLTPHPITTAVPPAAAAPKPTAALPSRISAASLPVNPSSRATASPTLGVWQQALPYATAVFATMALMVVGFLTYRRYSVRGWIDPKGRTTMKGETQAGSAQTFAHFGVMTEPAEIKQRVPLVIPPNDGMQVEQNELDTLLADIQASTIDERQVKEAYKSVAIEGGIDVGADSILRAIAEAERQLQLGTPEPAQVALDHALDQDLLTIPNIPKSARSR